MSLIYRGQTAQPSAIAHTVATDKTGTFLGRPYPIRTAQHPAQRTAQHLQYRGARY